MILIKNIFLVLILLLLLFTGMHKVIFEIFGFQPITPDEVNNYTKFGAIFTIIGSVFTIINAFLILWLMCEFHKKETTLNMVSHINDLRKELINIEVLFRKDLEYFQDRQFGVSEALYDIYHNDKNGFDDRETPLIYRQEEKALIEVIHEFKKLYQSFLTLKRLVNENDLSYEKYRQKNEILMNLNDIMAIEKPSSQYKKSFLDGSRSYYDAEYIIENAKKNSLQTIRKMSELLAR